MERGILDESEEEVIELTKSGGEGAAAPLADRSREARHFSALMMMIGTFRTYTMLLAPAPPSLILCPVPPVGWEENRFTPRGKITAEKRRNKSSIGLPAKPTSVEAS